MAGNSVAERLQGVREKIARAAEKSGRKPEEISLVAVSKMQPVEKIRELHRAGVADFGENYVQELAGKMSVLPDLKWHFIGGLQRNKAKAVVGAVDAIQSVDRKELAETIQRLAFEKSLIQKILVQVNIGDEASKGGVSVADFEALLAAVWSCANLELAGLMCLPPLSESEKETRRHFQQCRLLFEKMRKLCPRGKTPPTVLSMGTTGDFAWAVEEGSTMVRIGTALFGERPSA